MAEPVKSGRRRWWGRTVDAALAPIVWAHPAARRWSRLTGRAAAVVTLGGIVVAHGTLRYVALGLFALATAIDVGNLLVVRRLRRDPDWRPPPLPKRDDHPAEPHVSSWLDWRRRG